MTERGPQSGEPRRPTLDDLLDRADGVTELQRRAGSDPEFCRQLDVQTRLDESLQRLFEAPEIHLDLSEQVRPVRGVWMRRLPWAAAAALLLAVLGGWWVWMGSAPGPDVLSPLYREVVAAGFKPETVCTTDAEFVNWCRSYMRQPIYPGARPAGLELVGWDTTTTIGPVTGVLLARVDGDPVLVVMNRTDRQSVRPTVDPQGQLHMFKKRLGDVVLYEITPKANEVVLPTLSASPPR